jgi:N utilization substance protein B
MKDFKDNELLQWLFSMDVQKHAGNDDVAPAQDETMPEADAPLCDSSRAILTDILAVLPQIDRKLSMVSLHWRLDRMSMIDRNILRMFAFGILYLNLPKGQCIHRALELAKLFSEAKSPMFIHAILDQLQPVQQPADVAS